MHHLGTCPNKKECALARAGLAIPFLSEDPHCPDCAARLVMERGDVSPRTPSWISFSAFAGLLLILIFAVGNFLFQASMLEPAKLRDEAAKPTPTPQEAKKGLVMNSTAMGLQSQERVVAAQPVTLQPNAAPPAQGGAVVNPTPASERVVRAMPVDIERVTLRESGSLLPQSGSNSVR